MASAAMWFLIWGIIGTILTILTRSGDSTPPTTRRAEFTPPRALGNRKDGLALY